MKIDMKEFVNNIEKALQTKKVATYQGATDCKYLDDEGRSCIVGVGFTESQRQEISKFNDESICGLFGDSFVEIPEKYQTIINNMQEAHDNSLRKDCEARRKIYLKEMHEHFARLKEMVEAS